MTTFSQLVDAVVTELVRPDMVGPAAAFLNSSIRSVHFKSTSNAPARFAENRCEDELTVLSANPFTWALPNPGAFQAFESAYSRAHRLYFKEKTPSTAQRYSDEPFDWLYYYRAGPSFYFAGVSEGDSILISWFEYPKRLLYKSKEQRTVVYDPDSGYIPGPAAAGNPANMKLEDETNWLLERWGVEVLGDGIRQRIWGRLGETERARMAYSTFNRGIDMIWQTEGTL